MTFSLAKGPRRIELELTETELEAPGITTELNQVSTIYYFDEKFS